MANNDRPWHSQHPAPIAAAWNFFAFSSYHLLLYIIIGLITIIFRNLAEVNIQHETPWNFHCFFTYIYIEIRKEGDGDEYVFRSLCRRFAGTAPVFRADHERARTVSENRIYRRKPLG